MYRVKIFEQMKYMHMKADKNVQRISKKLENDYFNTIQNKNVHFI